MKKNYTFFVLLIAIISASIELDIYVPSFPGMLKFFAISENEFHWILSINFLGLSLSGLIYGPLSDLFGRKQIMLIGLGIFSIASLGCVYSTNILELVFWRFWQGVGASVPITIGFAVINDLYDENEASQRVSLLNGVITFCMAGAPIVGSFLDIKFGWNANFKFIFLLALVAFVNIFFFLDETINKKNQQSFSIKNFFNNYLLIIKNLKFIILSVISSFMYAGLIIYIAFNSLLLMNHLNIAKEYYGFYQSFVMIIFLIFSFLAVKLIKTHGVIKIQFCGTFIALIGSIVMVAISYILSTSAIAITLSMALFVSGIAIAIGTYVVNAINHVPELGGTSSALLGAIKLIITSFCLSITGYFFNGGFSIIAIIIFIMMGLSSFLWLTLDKKVLNKDLSL